MNYVMFCAVAGERFPAEGKCLSISAGAAGGGYGALCPLCRVWSSRPFLKSHKIVYIVSCAKCGYIKRIIEEVK